MNDVRLKVSYLKGLAEGMKIEDEKTNRLISEIILVLDEMAEAVEDLKITMDDTQEYVESIDEDLGELEEEFYDEDFDDYEEDDYDDELGFDDEDFVITDCPNCHETVYIDEDFIVDGKAECPNCKEVIEFEDEETVED